MIQIFETQPENFQTKLQCAGCYLEWNEKILLLQRSEKSSEGGCWGVPAGKLESGEEPFHAAKRELFEETGINIQDESRIQFLKTLYIRKPHVEYLYHMFKVHLDRGPEVVLDPKEHQDYLWASNEDIKNLKLMAGAKVAFQHYRSSNF